MALYRHCLPQLQGRPCITDGGLETDLIFNRGIDLPEFASYHLLREQQGRRELRKYFSAYLAIARRHGLGLVLDTPTWRANADWGRKLGDDSAALDDLNRAAVELLLSLRDELADTGLPLVISGCLGPRGDGYHPGQRMSERQARDYHQPQVASFAASAADMVTALTINYVEEAIGIALAARELQIPACISFTVETDGCLPGGQALPEAIDAVDEATGGSPAYYMINCAHPSHFAAVFAGGGEWLRRVRGLRANASCKSHAELDEADALDDGDPRAFGRELVALRQYGDGLSVLGGCCGTDHRHLERVAVELRETLAQAS